LYGRFQDNAPQPVSPLKNYVFILTRPDNPWGRPVLLLNGATWPLTRGLQLPGRLCDQIIRALVARIRSHILIHAGAVVHQAQGFLLVGDSGHGKTTLVLALLRRGFRFLSDEVAALGRADGMVAPFPRSLHLRPGTLERVGYGALPDDIPAWTAGQFIDIERIQPGSLGASAPIRRVIVLQSRPPAQAMNSSAADERPDTIHFLLDRPADNILASLRRLAEVQVIDTERPDGYWAIQVTKGQRAKIIQAVEKLCREQRILILEMVKRPPAQPDFTGPARLEPLSLGQTLGCLNRQFEAGHGSHLQRADALGSPTRLLMELAKLMRSAVCHRLTLGPPEQMADLVCGLVGRG
jgi:hypothetical protein